VDANQSDTTTRQPEDDRPSITPKNKPSRRTELTSSSSRSKPSHRSSLKSDHRSSGKSSSRRSSTTKRREAKEPSTRSNKASKDKVDQKQHRKESNTDDIDQLRHSLSTLRKSISSMNDSIVSLSDVSSLKSEHHERSTDKPSPPIEITCQTSTDMDRDRTKAYQRSKSLRKAKSQDSISVRRRHSEIDHPRDSKKHSSRRSCDDPRSSSRRKSYHQSRSSSRKIDDRPARGEVSWNKSSRSFYSSSTRTTSDSTRSFRSSSTILSKSSDSVLDELTQRSSHSTPFRFGTTEEEEEEGDETRKRPSSSSHPTEKTRSSSSREKSHTPPPPEDYIVRLSTDSYEETEKKKEGSSRSYDGQKKKSRSSSSSHMSPNRIREHRRSSLRKPQKDESSQVNLRPSSRKLDDCREQTEKTNKSEVNKSGPSIIEVQSIGTPATSSSRKGHSIDSSRSSSRGSMDTPSQSTRSTTRRRQSKRYSRSNTRSSSRSDDSRSSDEISAETKLSSNIVLSPEVPDAPRRTTNIVEENAIHQPTVCNNSNIPEPKIVPHSQCSLQYDDIEENSDKQTMKRNIVSNWMTTLRTIAQPSKSTDPRNEQPLDDSNDRSLSVGIQQSNFTGDGNAQKNAAAVPPADTGLRGVVQNLKIGYYVQKVGGIFRKKNCIGTIFTHDVDDISTIGKSVWSEEEEESGRREVWSEKEEESGRRKVWSEEEAYDSRSGCIVFQREDTTCLGQMEVDFPTEGRAHCSSHIDEEERLIWKAARSSSLTLYERSGSTCRKERRRRWSTRDYSAKSFRFPTSSEDIIPGDGYTSTATEPRVAEMRKKWLSIKEPTKDGN